MNKKNFITKELLEYINKFDEEIMSQFTHYSKKEMLLSRMTKLSEETGELANEILASVGYQRPEKLNNHFKETLEKEFADVFITALLLAKSAEININHALKTKIAILKKRYENTSRKEQ